MRHIFQKNGPFWINKFEFSKIWRIFSIMLKIAKIDWSWHTIFWIVNRKMCLYPRENVIFTNFRKKTNFQGDFDFLAFFPEIWTNPRKMRNFQTTSCYFLKSDLGFWTSWKGRVMTTESWQTRDTTLMSKATSSKLWIMISYVMTIIMIMRIMKPIKNQ